MVEVDDDVGEDAEEIEGHEEQDDIVLSVRGEEGACELSVVGVDFARAAAGRRVGVAQEGLGGRGHAVRVVEGCGLECIFVFGVLRTLDLGWERRKRKGNRRGGAAEGMWTRRICATPLLIRIVYRCILCTA